ncbi:MAG: VOC family protein [Bacteroidetes bacterium]|nr:VOC family protein [Bacteroidota bacterium]
MKFICTLIAVTDIKRSREFYENVLDQKVKYDFGENITFHGDFAIHLKSHYKELIDSREIVSGGNNFELYFEYHKVDEIAEKLKNENVEFVHEVREQPWRQKVVRFYDPDKNIIEVGESLEYLSYRLNKEGNSSADIAKIIGLPIEFVEESIKTYS